MKLNKITLELTEDEIITIHNALETVVENEVKGTAKMPAKAIEILGFVEDEIKILRQLNQYFGYRHSIFGNSFQKYKQYDDVDEWVKALKANAIHKSKEADKEKVL